MNAPQEQTLPADPQALRESIIQTLRGIYDPEIPINIYDLGLIYHLDVNPQGEVRLEMTLTAPGCPVAQTFPSTVESKVESVPGVSRADVELVWDPPWTKDRMSEAAQLQLGMLEGAAKSNPQDGYQSITITPRVPAHLTSQALTEGEGQKPGPEKDWVDVAYEGDIEPGEWKSVEVEGVHVAVFNLEGRFYAIEDVCTHDGGTLTGGTVQADQVICPRHGARFSIKTGAVLSPPAYEPIATFPLRVRDGVVQIRDDRWDV